MPRGTLAPSTPDLPLRSGPPCKGSLKGVSRTGWSGRGHSLVLLSVARRGRLCSTSAADSDLAVIGECVQPAPVASLTCISCPRAASSQWGCRACGAPGGQLQGWAPHLWITHLLESQAECFAGSCPSRGLHVNNGLLLSFLVANGFLLSFLVARAAEETCKWAAVHTSLPGI